jgi:hypothetical protein
MEERIAASKFHRGDGEGGSGYNKDDYDRGDDDEVAEPIIIAQALCTAQTLAIPFTGQTLRKDDFGLVLVMIDFLAIVSIMAFIRILEAKQLEYIERFKR